MGVRERNRGVEGASGREGVGAGREMRGRRWVPCISTAERESTRHSSHASPPVPSLWGRPSMPGMAEERRRRFLQASEGTGRQRREEGNERRGEDRNGQRNAERN